MTTSFSKLSIGVGPPDVCNGNKVCEKTRGEDSKNCKSDCKPWGRIILYIVLLLFAGFWGYIGLQEWYKRYYENHLFKNKTDLFNLINFMNNAINQGLEKGYILRSLEKLRWKREQVIYAFNKFKGKRTGMWEIPLFKWVENKKVKEEISKRQNAERMRREVKGGEARRRSFRY